MDWLQVCTEYYKAGYYDNTSLKVFVAKGKITATDYQNIAGIDYVA